MQKKTNFVIAFLFFVLCFFACRKNSKNPSWDVDVLTPLVKSTLTINNIITDSFLHSNTDNSLSIVYKYSLTSFNIDSLFKIPDTTLKNKYISYFPPIAIQPGGTIVPLQIQNIQSVNIDAQLTQVIIRSGYMVLSIKSSIKEKTNVLYTLPKVVDSYGKFFSITAVVPKATSTNGTYNAKIDLSGYKIDLTGTTGTSVNTMQINYTAIVDPTAPDSAHVATFDSVVISNSFVDIVPQYAKGYLGHTITHIGPDSAAFTMFSHITDGAIKFEDIDFRMSIQNSIGVDARITINNLSSINSRTGITKVLSNSIIGSPLNINRSIDKSGIISPTTYSVSFTPSNSNIKQFMENLPDKLSYQLDLEINPLGNVSGGNDFVYYDKFMKTELNMTIPLSLAATNLTMADTLDFNMPASADNVNSGNIYLYAENGFPFTAEAQLYLMDAGFHIVDSLVSIPNAIFHPQLDANFICVGTKLTKLTIPVNEEKLSLLRKIDKMYIKMKFNTASQPTYVKIYSFYKMNIKLVGDFNYTIGKN